MKTARRSFTLWVLLVSLLVAISIIHLKLSRWIEHQNRYILPQTYIYVSGKDEGPFIDPFSNLISSHEETLKFLNLPVRIYSKSYNEITSANRGSNQPFPPDFSFHLEYGSNHVTIYEDYGPGCVFKMFLLPQLWKTDHRRSWVSIDVDGYNFSLSLQDMYSGNSWPFKKPLSTNQTNHAAGIGAYTPICYQQRMKIRYIFNNNIPSDTLEKNIDCTLNNKHCDYQATAGVSRHKFPIGTRVKSFAGLKVCFFYCKT